MKIESRQNASVVELLATTVNKEPQELLRARTQAKTLILNNELYDKLRLRFPEDIDIFTLSVEERLLRNEIVKVSDKISNLKNKGVLGFINKEIIKRQRKKIENLYKAKEIIYLQKDDIVRFLLPKEKEKAHNLDLAANGLFRIAQEIHKNALIPETILDDWIVNDWANAWRKKIEEE